MAAAHRAPLKAKSNSRISTTRSILNKAVLRPIETLETRRLLSAAVLATPDLNLSLVHPAAGAAFTGYTPAQIRKAYGFDSITGQGAGQTIAIVDAYDDPTIISDLQTFDAQYGLANPPSITVYNSDGTTDLSSLYPDPTSDWTIETALDVEYVHTVAPNANIDLVECAPDPITGELTIGDLMGGVNTARYLSGVSAISMSWGSREFAGDFLPPDTEDPSQIYYDRFMTAPAGHAPETFVASSGDDGVAAASWPATSPTVLSVGGTNLTLNSNNSYKSEGVWIGSQGGESEYEATPAYQASVTKTAYRATPDVSIDADPNTGVSVYNTTDDGGTGEVGYIVVGGTSAGAPMWSGFIGDVDSMRATSGLAPLDGANNTLPALYQLALGKKTRYESAFNDIATGQNGNIAQAELPITPEPLSTVPIPRGGSDTGFSAEPGWDMVTGLGTPKATVLASYLANFVPIKVVHRSAKRRTADVAANDISTAAMKKSNVNVSAQVTLSDDFFTLSKAIATAPVATSTVNPPAAYTIKLLNPASAAVLSTVLSSPDNTVTVSGSVNDLAPSTVRSLQADGSRRLDIDEAIDESLAPLNEDDSSAVPPTNSAAPVPQNIPQMEGDFNDAAPAVAPQPASPSVPLLPSAVSAEQPQAAAVGGQFNAKHIVPMMLGVVAGDAVLLGRWIKRLDAKRRKKQLGAFNFTALDPRETD